MFKTSILLLKKYKDIFKYKSKDTVFRQSLPAVLDSYDLYKDSFLKHLFLKLHRT